MDRQEIEAYRKDHCGFDYVPDDDVEKVMILRRMYPGANGLTVQQCLGIIRDMEANGEGLPPVKVGYKKTGGKATKQKTHSLFGWG